jgi:hypothetical protein
MLRLVSLGDQLVDRFTAEELAAVLGGWFGRLFAN